MVQDVQTDRWGHNTVVMVMALVRDRPAQTHFLSGSGLVLHFLLLHFKDYFTPNKWIYVLKCTWTLYNQKWGLDWLSVYVIKQTMTGCKIERISIEIG